MKISLSPLIQKIPSRAFWQRVRIEFVGLLQDLWKDPPRPEKPSSKTSAAEAGQELVPDKKKKEKAKQKASAELTFKPSAKRWHADRFQIMEKIWGEGRNLPSPPELEELLVTSLTMSSEKDLLDLAAGLGGLDRQISKNYGASIAGMETDAVMVRRAMSLTLNSGADKKLSFEHYDPVNFFASRKFDCVIARELFYRIIGKEKFFQAISAGLKQHGMLVFTDYIMDKKARENKAVALWTKYEPTALPLSLQEMVGEWTKLKFDVRVNEDMTDLYHFEIMKRLKNFADFLAKTPPDADTKNLVLQETELWVRRAEAMRQGLKVYRFETIKM